MKWVPWHGKLFDQEARDTRPDQPGTPPIDPPPGLPDPAQPPSKRGSWEQAALTNVDITEIVKQQIRTDTQPWEK